MLRSENQAKSSGNTLSQVKASRISAFLENFKTKDDEYVNEKHARFTEIMNELDYLHRRFSHIEMIRKVLASLPKG